MIIINEIPELFKMFNKTAGKVAITSDLYDYFLNVLPPKFMTRNRFIFQEGEDELIEFTKILDDYSAVLLTAQFVDVDYTVLFNVHRTSEDEKFLLRSINYINDTEERDSLNELVGKHFLLISDLENQIGLELKT